MKRGYHDLYPVLLATAKLNGLNPFEYANVLLEELPKRTANNIDDLLPHIWKPSQNKKIPALTRD